MSQRISGYERKERDCYETPEWVTVALVPHLPPLSGVIWEPAAGSRKMVRALEGLGLAVLATDIADDPPVDFLLSFRHPAPIGAIITNPPYAHAGKFIDRAMELMEGPRGVVAMLLRTDYDHAASRLEMFDGPFSRFAKKVVLTRRIKWFEDSTGSPSFNHAWFIWDWKHSGPPTLAYGP